MKETSILIEEFEKIQEGDLLSIIDFFETNEDSLLFKESHEIGEIDYIYIDYLVSLLEKSRYSRILEIVEKLEKLDEFKKYRNSDLDFDEDLRFYKYSSLYYKKRYRESKKGFEKLVHDFPKNEDYHGWLIDSMKGISTNVFRLIMFSTGALMFLILVIRMYWSLPLLGTLNRIAEALFILSIVLFFIDLKRKRKMPILKEK
jgi:tetratricopeptide (TPR) repeat protein